MLSIPCLMRHAKSTPRRVGQMRCRVFGHLFSCGLWRIRNKHWLPASVALKFLCNLNSLAQFHLPLNWSWPWRPFPRRRSDRYGMKLPNCAFNPTINPHTL